MSDFEYDADGVSATLSFGKVGWKYAFVPWVDMIAIRGTLNGKQVVYTFNMETLPNTEPTGPQMIEIAEVVEVIPPEEPGVALIMRHYDDINKSIIVSLFSQIYDFVKTLFNRGK